MRHEAKRRGEDRDRKLEDLLAQKTRELTEAEVRFRTLFDGIPELVIVHDAGGTIRMVNQVAAAELGRPQAELVGTNLRTLVQPGDGERVLGAAVQAHAQGTATFEATCVTPSGRKLELVVNCRALDLDGQPAVLSVGRDVTAQRSAERQRADFMAMVAHDIRNPLSVVVGYAEMLREQAAGVDAGDMLARLVTNAHAVVSLVSNYLDLSRIEAGHLTLNTSRVDLNEVLLNVGELYQDEARRRKIRFEVAAVPMPPVRGDANALERVLGNLVHNAIKYTPAEGQITVFAQNEGASAAIGVSDTGPGIPDDEVATIFDRYRRTFDGRAKNGSGLGLFIAKALVEAHGGKITVDTRHGSGCTFAVRLPLNA